MSDRARGVQTVARLRGRGGGGGRRRRRRRFPSLP